MLSSKPSRRTCLAWGAAFAATLVFHLGDGDIWWHVRAGQWIWDHGAIPTVDPFSHTAEGPWRYTEALAQLALYGAHAQGGVTGLALLGLVVGVVLGVLVARLAAADAGTTGLVTGLWGASSLAAMALKPQLFSYVLFAGVLLAMREVEARLRDGEGVRGLLAIPVLFLLWAGLHRGGTLGLFVLGAAVLTWSFDARLRPQVPWLALTLLASVGALCLGSGGTYYLRSAFDLTTREGFAQLADWAPLDAATLVDKHLALLPLLTAWIAGRVLGRRPPDLDLAVVLGTAALFASGRRFAPFFAMALVPGAAAAIARAQSLLCQRWADVRPAVVRFAAGGLGLAILATTYTRMIPASQWGIGIVESRVPVELAAFLRENPPGGRMWNSFDLGGYLVFALAPEQKVFIDGRNDTVYDAAFFVETLQAPTRPDIFARQLERYGVGYVVARSADLEGPSLYALGADPRWTLVYLDDVGAVFVDRGATSPEYLRRFEYPELRPAGALQRAARLGGSPADRQFAADVARNRTRNPESIRAHYLAALVARSRGDVASYAQARADVDRLARLRGVDLPLP